MAADRGVGPVEDRAGLEQALGGPEHLLHHPQLLVSQGDVHGCQGGVGSQHPDAVEAFLVARLVAIDRDRTPLDPQVAPEAPVGDEAPGALPVQPALQTGQDPVARRGVLARLGRIAAHDVATRPVSARRNRDVLDLQLHRVRALADNLDGLERRAVGENRVPDLLRPTRAGAEDVLPAPRLDRGDHVPGDHPGVGHKAHRADPEALLQAGRHQVQRRHVGGVAGPHLAAHRHPVAVEHHPQNHLPAVAATVLALAVPAQALAALAGEVQRRGVEEHEIEIGEQVAPPVEQGLLDPVLDAPLEALAGLAVAKRLAEPAHRSVELVQFQRLRAFDLPAPPPLQGAAVRAGDHEAVQDGEEHGALDVEAEVPSRKQGAHRPAASALAPQALEDQGGADDHDFRVRPVPRVVLGQDDEGLGEAGGGGRQPVDGSGRGEPVEPSDGGDDGLPDLFALAAVLDDLEVLVLAGGLEAKEHGGLPVCTTP